MPKMGKKFGMKISDLIFFPISKSNFGYAFASKAENRNKLSSIVLNVIFIRVKISHLLDLSLYLMLTKGRDRRSDVERGRKVRPSHKTCCLMVKTLHYSPRSPL